MKVKFVCSTSASPTPHVITVNAGIQRTDQVRNGVN